MRRLMTRRRDNRPPNGDATHRIRRLRLPTSGAALAVSTVALVVAMAGSAYAGVTLGKGSVGSKQLKKGSVTAKKLAAGAVTNGKIAKGAISAGKLKTGLTVPNASHAGTADSATTAASATDATNATTATTATNGIVSFGTWAGPTSTIPITSGFVFVGPTITLATTATQSVVASSESALATSAANAPAEIAICKAAATGTATVTELNPAPGGAFSSVVVTTVRATYAANETGAPGAGTWKIGECVNNTSAAQAIDNNDWTLGNAFVVNGAAVQGPAPVGPGH